MKNVSCFSLAVTLALLLASPVGAAVNVEFVGTNPFGSFPSTGGTGAFDTTAQGVIVTKEFTSLGDVPIIINSGPSTGFDTLTFFERVTNNSGTDWTDFHLIVQRIDASQNLAVTFANITNSTGEFNNNSTGLGFLSFFGPIPNGSSFSIGFTLQVADSVGAFPLFGIHEVPSVPEPSSIALISLGTVGMLGIAWRRRRKRNG